MINVGGFFSYLLLLLVYLLGFIVIVSLMANLPFLLLHTLRERVLFSLSRVSNYMIGNSMKKKVNILQKHCRNCYACHEPVP